MVGRECKVNVSDESGTCLSQKCMFQQLSSMTHLPSNFVALAPQCGVESERDPTFAVTLIASRVNSIMMTPCCSSPVCVTYLQSRILFLVNCMHLPPIDELCLILPKLLENASKQQVSPVPASRV